jgi:hypothetical protein
MNVEFDENKPINYNYPPKNGGLSGFIIKTGFAKDEAGAKKVMITIAIICFALSIYFFLKAL